MCYSQETVVCWERGGWNRGDKVQTNIESYIDVGLFETSFWPQESQGEAFSADRPAAENEGEEGARMVPAGAGTQPDLH